jgi:PLP dependent protein
VEANLRRIRECIARAADAARRDPVEVTVIAVTKKQPAEAIEIAYEAGIRHFGENRVQEWEEKRPQVATLEATWHLIGHLQSNKLKRALDVFDCIDSVDSLELAQKLDRARAGGPKLPILLEVRTDLVSAKTGLHPDELQSVAESVLSLPNLELRGLMTIPPPFPSNDQARPYFRYLREMRNALERRFQFKFPMLSMGMSNDFEAAIAEGATEVRLGTALFGERPRAQ